MDDPFALLATVMIPFVLVFCHDKTWGRPAVFPVKTTESECVAELFRRYQALAAKGGNR